MTPCITEFRNEGYYKQQTKEHINLFSFLASIFLFIYFSNLPVVHKFTLKVFVSSVLPSLSKKSI